MGDATILIAILSGVTIPLITLAVGLFYQRGKNGDFEKEISELQLALHQRDEARAERDRLQERVDVMQAERLRFMKENLDLMRRQLTGADLERLVKQIDDEAVSRLNGIESKIDRLLSK